MNIILSTVEAEIPKQLKTFRLSPKIDILIILLMIMINNDNDNDKILTML